MNSELPLTRRDVVAIVIYATLGYNVLNSLLVFLGQSVLPRIPFLKAPVSSGGFSAVNAGVSFVLALAFLPFVSLIANGVIGRDSSQPATRRNFLSLTFRCVGLILFGLSFPHFAQGIYLYMQVPTYGNSASSIRPYYLQNIISTLICLSVGFALAFFPAIFASLRVPDDEGAA
ncbi:hypothetical protein IAD21_05341 [Abditibacteriota bacterium]|nr:hypothetical protein IAD21_05341 [Abditibacteriota bacterium]